MSSPAKQQPANDAAHGSGSGVIAPTDSAMQPASSEGPWSDPALSSTLASLAVVDEDGASNDCSDDWSFFVELVDDLFSEWPKGQSILKASTRDHHPWIFRNQADGLRDCMLCLRLPALVHITSAMRALGTRMSDIIAREEPERKQWTHPLSEPNPSYPLRVAEVMMSLKAWQRRLMPLLDQEFERLRTAMPPIRVRALLQQQQFEMDEALESAIDSRLEAHFQAA